MKMSIYIYSLKNISLGGLCAILGRVIKRGDDLLIELDLPYNKRLATLAKVVWVKPSDNNRGNICGVKFLWASPPPLLKEYIAYARGT